jgi:hypothetical protein
MPAALQAMLRFQLVAGRTFAATLNTPFINCA